MIIWYLLIVLGSGAPTRSIYVTESDACNAYLTEKLAGTAYIYKISGHRDNPMIENGDCQPVHQFVVTK